MKWGLLMKPEMLLVKSGEESRIPRIPRIDVVVETLYAMSLPLDSSVSLWFFHGKE
jgi:hypothetical protein